MDLFLKGTDRWSASSLWTQTNMMSLATPLLAGGCGLAGMPAEGPAYGLLVPGGVACVSFGLFPKESLGIGSVVPHLSPAPSHLPVQRPEPGFISASLWSVPCSHSVNRAIINSQDARQPDSARRQEISPNYYIHIVSKAHFTASANLKWQVPTFHSKITIFVLFYYMVIFVHYSGYVNLVL